MTREYVFPRRVRIYGLLSLSGLAIFAISLMVVHSTITDFDWIGEYVSNLANKPLGIVFIVGTFIHGCGNLALTLGLWSALHPGRLRTWAVIFFGLAALGILLTALFTIESPGTAPGATGRIHRAVASATFIFELAALFVFTLVFSNDRRWYRQRSVSLILSAGAAVSMMMFIIAIQVNVAPGLAERTALAFFLVWEIWICFQLMRSA